MEWRNVNQGTVREGVMAVMRDLKLNPNALATKVGIDASNLARKIKGQQNFTERDVWKFSDIGVNPDYLVTGDGSMYVISQGSGSNSPLGVPIFDQEFACGFLEVNDTAVTPVGYASLPGTYGATCWCKASGDSMRPLVNNGDYICLKRIEDWNQFIIWGDIYAIETVNEMRTVKRIEKGNDDDELMLVPVNKDYTPQPIKKALIRGIYKVVCVSKMF